MGTVSSNQSHKRVEMKENDILCSKSNQYLVEEVLGKGFFSKVALCKKLGTKEKIAVKVLGDEKSGAIEALMLEQLRMLDPDKNNLVKLNEQFYYRGYNCLGYEMLDVTLYDHMNRRQFKPMHLFEIQMITQQMLVALNAIKSIGVVHTDIKPDNIMFIDYQHRSARVKLIDFGMARPLWLLQGGPGRVIQALHFRAPEVILGLDLNEAVDMWSLGCVLAFMFLGQSLYPGCEYEIIKSIVETMGPPDDHLLDSGIYTNNFFTKDPDSQNSSWKLHTHDEYKKASKIQKHSCTGTTEPNRRLKDVLEFSPDLMDIIQERQDTMAFLCLLKRMLNVDPEKRIKPSEALESRFMTDIHWKDINPTLSMSVDFLMKLLGQLDESTGKFNPWVDKNNAAGNTKEPSATAGLNEASTSEVQWPVGAKHNDKTTRNEKMQPRKRKCNHKRQNATRKERTQPQKKKRDSISQNTTTNEKTQAQKRKRDSISQNTTTKERTQPQKRKRNI